ncbi:MAG: cytochrome c3 family protein [Thermoanaerobaculia bacterium]
MSRPALTATALACAGWLAASAASGIHPHLDRSSVTGGCRACHEGHGVSRSPMLPGPQSTVCLSCHSSQAAADAMSARGLLSATAEPPLLSLDLSQPFSHPLDVEAFSRREPGVVTCTSCHSPHRLSGEPPSAAAGSRRLSTRDPNRFENQLCADCHGSAGVTTESLFDLSRFTSPNNRSFHPLEAPAVERSPSLRAELRDREINCTDCHGNSDPAGARGLHGSAVRHLLKAGYATVDGSPESLETYQLCYDCHDRDRILDDTSPFPLHRRHVVDRQVACATCHNAHGSVDNRALVRFGEETFLANVGPSGFADRLEFVSSGPGSGSCFVSCHGIDHAPASYGAAELLQATDALRALPTRPSPTRPPRPAPAERPRRPRRPPP